MIRSNLAASTLFCGLLLLPSPASADVLFISSDFNHEVLRYNPTTGAFIDTFIPASDNGPLNQPHAILDRGSDLLVASFGSNQILRFDRNSGDYLGPFIDAGGLLNPVYIALGPGSNLYISSQGNDSIRRYDQNGNFIDAFIPSASAGLDGPSGFAFGPDGLLYVAGRYSANVIAYDSITGAFDRIVLDSSDGLASGSTFGLNFSSNGDLHVASNNQIFRIDLSSDSVTATIPLGFPIGLEPGPSAGLFVATSNNLRFIDPLTNAASSPFLGTGASINLLNFFHFSPFPLTFGDTDADLDVDFDDFLAVQNFFGDPGPNSPGDADSDGDSDFNDFLAVQNFFGTESPGIAIPGASSLAFVPEPASSIALLLAASGFAFFRRRRRCPPILNPVSAAGRTTHMNRFHIIHRTLPSLFLFALLASSSIASATTYTQLDPAGSFSNPTYPVTGAYAAFGINDDGLVVGTNNFNALLWSSGSMLGFYAVDPINGVRYTQANDIANTSAGNAIVGTYADSNWGRHGYLLTAWSPVGFDPTIGMPAIAGSLTLLNVPDAPITEARGINDSLTIVGNTIDPNTAGTGGFTYFDSTYTIFSIAGSNQTQANDVNNSNLVVGSYQDNTGVYHGYVASLADISDNQIASFTSIDAPVTDAVATHLTGINDDGDLTGFYQDASGRFHGLFIEAGGFAALDYVGLNPPNFLFRDTWAFGLNASDAVVGQSVENTSDGGAIGGHAYLATDLTLTSLLGDTDGDLDVDFDDFLAVQNFFGDPGPSSPGDADSDGDSDFDDFLAVQNFFATPAPGFGSPGISIPGSSSLSFVPEPGTLTLLLPVAACALASRRRLPD